MQQIESDRNRERESTISVVQYNVAFECCYFNWIGFLSYVCCFSGADRSICSIRLLLKFVFFFFFFLTPHFLVIDWLKWQCAVEHFSDTDNIVHKVMKWNPYLSSRVVYDTNLCHPRFSCEFHLLLSMPAVTMWTLLFALAACLINSFTLCEWIEFWTKIRAKEKCTSNIPNDVNRLSSYFILNISINWRNLEYSAVATMKNGWRLITIVFQLKLIGVPRESSCIDYGFQCIRMKDEVMKMYLLFVLA